MIKTTLILLTLGMGLCYAENKPKCAPDICAWNAAVADMHAYAEQERIFSQAAIDWAHAKQAEVDDAGTVSSEALKKFTAMWVAWQNLRTAFKKAEKSMHDFNVIEMNRN